MLELSTALQVMSWATSNVQKWPVSSLTWTGSFTPLSNPLSSPAKMFTLLELFSSFRCKWTAESCPEELALLCAAIRLRRGCRASNTLRQKQGKTPGHKQSNVVLHCSMHNLVKTWSLLAPKKNKSSQARGFKTPVYTPLDGDSGFTLGLFTVTVE